MSCKRPIHLIQIFTIVLCVVVGVRSYCEGDEDCSYGKFCDDFGECQSCMACGPPDGNGDFSGEKEKCRREAPCPNYCYLRNPVQPHICEAEEPTYNLTCPVDIGTTTTYNTSYATVDRVAPIIIPNSDEVTVRQVSINPEPGGQFPIGTTVISYEAVISEKTVDNCSYKIIVDDIEPPVIKCPDNITILTTSRKPQAVDRWEEPESWDNSGNSTLLPLPYSMNHQFPVGETIITRTARDPYLNIQKCSYMVIIIDTNIECPEDTINSTLEPRITGGKADLAWYKCINQTGEVNVTVRCDLYWGKKRLNNCSYVIYKQQPTHSGGANGERRDWKMIWILLGLVFIILTVTVCSCCRYLFKRRNRKCVRKLLFWKSEEKERKARSEEEGTELMVDHKEPNNMPNGVISIDERYPAVDPAEPHVPDGNELIQIVPLPDPPHQDHNDHNQPPPPNDRIPPDVVDGHPNGYIPGHPVHNKEHKRYPSDPSKKFPDKQMPQADDRPDENRELHIPITDRRVYDIKKPPASIEDIDSLRTPLSDSANETPRSSDSENASVPSGNTTSSTPSSYAHSSPSPTPSEPHFTILYWTEQSVYIQFTQTEDIENYELRYCLESNKTHEEKITIKTDTLCKVSDLQSNTKYEFTLQRRNSKDGSGKTIIKETAAHQCNQTLTDLMNNQDLMPQLCKHLDPKEHLWRAIGGSYGLSNEDLDYIRYHKTPDSYPVTRQLIELIRDKNLGETENKTICRLLQELHWRRDNFKGALKVMVLILRWHALQEPQCQLCSTNGMFDYGYIPSTAL